LFRVISQFHIYLDTHNILIEFQLDGEGYQLSWLRRMKIAIGVARGLRYLHTELQPPFTMSELNSSAVYLTEDFSPKVFIIQLSVKYGLTSLFL